MPARKKKIEFHRSFRKPSDETIQKILRSASTKKKVKKHVPTLLKLADTFKRIPAPTDELDWLAQYGEPGQDFVEFMEDCPVGPTDTLGTKQFIYYVQCGEFTQTPIQFDALIQYGQCFFSVESVVSIEQKVSIKRVANKRSKHGFNLIAEYGKIRQTMAFRYDVDTDKVQLNTSSFHLMLQKMLPDNACCLIALTEYDLYVDEEDLFVAGLAEGKGKVAVFSYLRYNPNLKYSEEFWYNYEIKKSKKFSEQKSLAITLGRACKLLVHETMHLLGFDHCIYMDCCMNGSGHLQEDFRQSMLLCPIDLKKLLTLFELDLLERFEKLMQFYLEHKLTGDVKPLENIIAKIKS